MSGLVYPWSVAFLPDGEMLITERPGRLRILSERTRGSRLIGGVPELVNLFDVVPHPNFSDNRLVFLAYSAEDSKRYGLEVLRARLHDDGLVDKEVIFRAAPKTGNMPLSGGRLLFASDGALLISVGDHQDGRSYAQDRSSHLGAVVKIERPAAAPAAGAESAVDAPVVHTSGHRNVQGLAIDDRSGEIWITEHGPVDGDELNLLVAGGNYGWPIEHFGEDDPSPGSESRQPDQRFEKPVLVWTPAIAPSGLAIYRGRTIRAWDGSLFVGSLTGCYVLRVRLDGDNELLSEEKLLGELGERIRDVRIGPDEAVYVLTDEIDGKLIRFGPPPAPDMEARQVESRTP